MQTNSLRPHNPLYTSAISWQPLQLISGTIYREVVFSDYDMTTLLQAPWALWSTRPWPLALASLQVPPASPPGRWPPSGAMTSWLRPPSSWALQRQATRPGSSGCLITMMTGTLTTGDYNIWHPASLALVSCAGIMGWVSPRLGFLTSTTERLREGGCIIRLSLASGTRTSWAPERPRPRSPPSTLSRLESGETSIN